MGELDTKIADLLEKQTKILELMNTKTAATSMTANKLHGINGLFSTPGLERDVITAYVRPRGIATALAMLPSVDEDPRFGSITGYTSVVGSQPTAVCADAPYGYMKGCNLTAVFGILRFDTNTIDIEKTMLRVNRGEMTDLVLRGRVLGLTGLEPSGMNEADIVSIVTMSEMVTAAVNAERELSRQLWQGVVTTFGNFPGLDVQIATGQKDADSGTTCPALDSDIKDFNYDLVGGTGRSIVEYLSMMAYYLEYNAVQMGLDPVEWAVVMRPELWFELSAVWPCQYLSARCSFDKSATNAMVINDNVNVAMRDAMREGMYIDINGKRYTVITDTGIYERNNINDANLLPGQYASSIYFVPLTIQGNFPVTYRQHLDYKASDRMRNSDLLKGMQTFWTDDGIYSWALEQVKWCYKLSLRTEQRVILRTPQLAGKIQKVKYTPLQHLREPYADSPYFADGGVSIRNYTTQGKAVWNSR